MQFDLFLFGQEMSSMPAVAHAAEELGFDGLWTAETAHNPFLPLALAAEHTRRLSLGTGIAVAFPRSPTVLAHIAWDLQRYSQGRFILGLGTQVKAHIVLRFGSRWDKPVRQMRETIEAIRAVWGSWPRRRHVAQLPRRILYPAPDDPLLRRAPRSPIPTHLSM